MTKAEDHDLELARNLIATKADADGVAQLLRIARLTGHGAGRAEMAAEVRRLLPPMALRSPTPGGKALRDLLAPEDQQKGLQS